MGAGADAGRAARVGFAKIAFRRFHNRLLAVQITHHFTVDIADFDKEQELQAYRDMLLIRRFEEKAGQLYGMGLIGGFCAIYISVKKPSSSACRQRRSRAIRW